MNYQVWGTLQGDRERSTRFQAAATCAFELQSEVLLRFPHSGRPDAFGQVLRFFTISTSSSRKQVFARVEMYKRDDDEAGAGLPTVDLGRINECIQIIELSDLTKRVSFVPCTAPESTRGPVCKALEKQARSKSHALDRAKSDARRGELVEEIADLRRQILAHHQVEARMCVLGSTIDLDEFFSEAQVKKHFPHLF